MPYKIVESHGKHTTECPGKFWKATCDVQYEACIADTAV